MFKGLFGWTVRLHVVSIKTVITERLNIVARDKKKTKRTTIKINAHSK